MLGWWQGGGGGGVRAVTHLSLKSPAAIAAGVGITMLLGVFSLYQLPVELLPEIDRPQIEVETSWRSQTPHEVESQIVEPEEAVLQGMPGLQEMEGHANFGEARISLIFPLGTDMNATLVDVIGRLDRIQSLPADAQKPLAQLANTKDKNATLMSVFLTQLPGNSGELSQNEGFIRDVVAPRLQAIAGVGGVQFTGNGTADELQIIFNPMRAAQFNIQIPKIASQIGTSDDVSGGTINVGRHKYGLSFRGRYSINGLKQTVLDWRAGNPVLLGDIADVRIAQTKPQDFAYYNGRPALEIDVFRASGADALATTKAIKSELWDINDGPAKDRNVVLQYVSDPTPFIHRAVGLVTFDIILGIALAVGVLWFFMRERHATLIVSSVIPICMFAVVFMLRLSGRSLNVVTLAGLAVASGMILDSAIVVLENILRLREAGVSAEESAHDGTHQVWRALFASTATNVAIFLPVIFLKDVEGQLSSDIALTIAFSVLVSFIVAITVVPVATNHFMKTRFKVHELKALWDNIAGRVMDLTESPGERRMWILALVAAPVVGTCLLFPSVHYLPEVKRGVIDVSLQYPPGATMEFVTRQIAQPLINRLSNFMSGAGDPKIDDWYFRSDSAGHISMALWMERSGDVEKMEEILRSTVLKGLPDTVGFATEESLFDGFDEGGIISINIQSSDVGAMRVAARLGFQLLGLQFPDAVIDTQPSLGYDEPQLELQPIDRAISEAGWTRVDVGNIAQTLGEGLYIGQRFDDGEQLYLILKSDPIESQAALENTPVATPQGNVVYFNNLVSVVRTLGSSGIYSLNGLQTYALNFQLPERIALGDALANIHDHIEPRIKAALPADGSVTYGAGANDLKDALWAMGENFALAVVILILIMAALFRSAIDALIAAIGLPLGMVGGVIGLRILGIFVFQPLDLLTMIGFIIVLGLAVNNTILLIARTREAEAEGLTRVAAVRSSLETRLRPIFSSTLTTIAGMLPLLIISGSGSEIYRGLSAVIIGGVLVSHAFTVVLMPALLRMGENQSSVGRGPQAPAGQPDTPTRVRL
jgi:multidrug efflux pump subunit AcrB